MRKKDIKKILQDIVEKSSTHILTALKQIWENFEQRRSPWEARCMFGTHRSPAANILIHVAHLSGKLCAKEKFQLSTYF